MPEGPEIARAAAFINNAISKIGKPLYLCNVIRFGSRFLNVDINELQDCLDYQLHNVFSKGKELFVIFNTAAGDLKGVKGHLGMGGRWFADYVPSASSSHEMNYNNIHFRLDFTTIQASPHPEFMIYYANERFGNFEIMKSKDEIESQLSRTALSFIGHFKITIEYWKSRWSMISGGKFLREVLMDQTLLCSGIGNYLLAEILWAARLHPDVKMFQITETEASDLFHICQYVIQGHYESTLHKVIYQKKMTPTGYPIEYLERKDRKIWYSPHEQIQR